MVSGGGQQTVSARRPDHRLGSGLFVWLRERIARTLPTREDPTPNGGRVAEHSPSMVHLHIATHVCGHTASKQTKQYTQHKKPDAGQQRTCNGGEGPAIAPPFDVHAQQPVGGMGCHDAPGSIILVMQRLLRALVVPGTSSTNNSDIIPATVAEHSLAVQELTPFSYGSVNGGASCRTLLRCWSWSACRRTFLRRDRGLVFLTRRGLVGLPLPNAGVHAGHR